MIGTRIITESSKFIVLGHFERKMFQVSQDICENEGSLKIELKLEKNTRNEFKRDFFKTARCI